MFQQIHTTSYKIFLGHSSWRLLSFYFNLAWMIFSLIALESLWDSSLIIVLKIPLPPFCVWIPFFFDGLCNHHSSPSYAAVTNNSTISKAFNDKGLFLIHITCWSWVAFTSVPCYFHFRTQADRAASA